MASAAVLSNITNTQPKFDTKQPTQLKSPINKKDDLGVPYTIIRVDMKQQYIRDILVIIRDAFTDALNDQQIATKIKQQCDTQYSGTYHVIVGKSFSTSISYETFHMMFVNMNDRNILVFKSIE